MGPRVQSPIYDVESIDKHRINSETLICEFNVKWKGWAKNDNTWEPLDNVKNVPLMLMNLQIKSRNKLLKSVGNISSEASKAIPNFPTIGSDIITKMKTKSDPMEFFPEGTEDFGRVICQIFRPNLELMLWKVHFRNLKSGDSSRFVRKDVISYYWPEEAALYATHAEQKELRFKRFLETQESERAAAKKVKKTE